jgi:hypothetical protein
MIPVDVLTVLAPGAVIAPPVLDALRNQGGVILEHRVVEGPCLPGERRVCAIARARNQAKTCGHAHYALFLDSDVVLPPLGIQQLLFGLLFSPHYAALGINYQDEVHTPLPAHVAMGATLFYRPILERIQFRVEPGTCECYCCCQDIRRMGYLIGYLPGIRAEHLRGGGYHAR